MNTEYSAHNQYMYTIYNFWLSVNLASEKKHFFMRVKKKNKTLISYIVCGLIYILMKKIHFYGWLLMWPKQEKKIDLTTEHFIHSVAGFFFAKQETIMHSMRTSREFIISWQSYFVILKWDFFFFKFLCKIKHVRNSKIQWN